MSGYCVIVAGSERAKILVSRDAIHPEVESGPNLVESAEMVIVNTDSDNKGDEALLAKKMVVDAMHLLRRNMGHHLVFAAESRMLALFRGACQHVDCSGIELVEYQGNLFEFSPERVQETLAQAQIMPHCAAASGVTPNS